MDKKRNLTLYENGSDYVRHNKFTWYVVFKMSAPVAKKTINKRETDEKAYFTKASLFDLIIWRK